MSFNELDLKRIEKEVKIFVENHRPPEEIREDLDISFRVEDESIFLFEIRSKWNNPDEKIEIPVAKATFVKARSTWKIFWQKSDLKWHKYEPLKEVKKVCDFLTAIDKDIYGCFWG